jgi:DNA-binding XRE family transcriptional regulator
MDINIDAINTNTPQRLKEVGERFKACRELIGLTTKQLARILEVNPSSIDQIEKGKYTPPVSMAFKLIRLYNLNIIWLYNGVGEMYLPPAHEKQENVDEVAYFMKVPSVEKTIRAAMANCRKVFKPELDLYEKYNDPIPSGVK